MSMIMYQTVERDSFFTRLDFRPKLFMIIVLTIIAFIWESPIAGGLLTLVLTISSLAVGVKWSYIRTIFTAMAIFGLILILVQGFFPTDRIKILLGITELTPLFVIPHSIPLIGGGTMTLEGTLYGLGALFRALIMVLVIPLGVFTTDVNTMIVGMVRAGIPYKIAFIFSSTLRFFPLLFEEIQSIIEAQRLRGLAMEKMGPIQRVKVYSRVAVPLIINALVESQTLEVVMHSKAFSGDPDRTYLHESKLGPVDYGALTFFALFFVGVLILYMVWGVGKFSWLLFG